MRLSSRLSSAGSRIGTRVRCGAWGRPHIPSAKTPDRWLREAAAPPRASAGLHDGADGCRASKSSARLLVGCARARREHSPTQPNERSWQQNRKPQRDRLHWQRQRCKDASKRSPGSGLDLDLRVIGMRGARSQQHWNPPGANRQRGAAPPRTLARCPPPSKSRCHRRGSHTFREETLRDVRRPHVGCRTEALTDEQGCVACAAHHLRSTGRPGRSQNASCMT